MEKHSLENCTGSLRKLRDVYSGQLDTGILEELDVVIVELEVVRKNPMKQMDLTQVSVRAIQVIASVISLLTNLKDWMR